MKLRYAEGFWMRVGRRPNPDACWPWFGARDRHGYGRVWRNSRMTRAARVAYELDTGERIPPGFVTLHSCDYPPCCNPRHLSAGSNQENENDKCAKGRQARGVTHGSVRLTPDQVQSIRGDSRPSREIAAEYGIHEGHVRRIRGRFVWRHLAKAVRTFERKEGEK